MKNEDKKAMALSFILAVICVVLLGFLMETGSL